MTSRFQAQIEKKVKARLGYHALWAIGPTQPVWLRPNANRPVTPVRFGISGDPGAQLDSACMWYWQNFDLIGLWWTKSQVDARRLHATVLQRLTKLSATVGQGEGFNPKWFDLPKEDVEVRVGEAARSVGVEVFSDSVFERRIEDAVEREVRVMRGW